MDGPSRRDNYSGKRGWDFCIENDRQRLPVEERGLNAIIGWLNMSIKRGTRNIVAASIPQYLSVVRRTHGSCTDRTVLPYPFVKVIVQAYGNWGEQQSPKDAVRCGVDATPMQRIWRMGLEKPSFSMLLDSSECVFSCYMNGFGRAQQGA